MNRQRNLPQKGNMIPQIDVELERFIEKYVNSFIKWDLLVFFHENPGTTDTSTSLANHLGRRPEDVRKALDELVEGEVLTVQADDPNIIYQYQPSPKVQPLIENFIKSLDSREKRLQILTKLLRLGGGR